MHLSPLSFGQKESLSALLTMLSAVFVSTLHALV